jgi:hypothetical protein
MLVGKASFSRWKIRLLLSEGINIRRIRGKNTMRVIIQFSLKTLEIIKNKKSKNPSVQIERI